MFITDLYAMAPPPSASGAPQNPLVSFMPMILIFLIFYFILIRPQQKKAKEQQKLLENLKKGDRVLLGCGIIGQIMNVRGNLLDLKLDENSKVQVLKSAVTQILKADEDPAALSVAKHD